MPKRDVGTFYLEDEPLWYKDAVIYELHIRAFYDSDGDGVGDIAGLAQKLDYLQDLGVTAIWLLPFYPSPLRDDGYDISDYTDVQPVYGTMSDFKALVDAAHRRGMRIITELVVNHTSDQHPWFQRARRAPRGSRWRRFYVWSDTPDRYRDARIIFKDYEHSNWTLDPVSTQYYWHRFYSHQPDLNYDSPAVRKAVFKVMDYWMRLGVDGLRVDAVPYLYEREGTNCENLPETHAFIKELRAHIDGKYRSRILLAEANQWPEDAVAYFGDSDEFHMAFHFPLMPRMFMAIRMEDRFPIVDILQNTPQIADTCQWALFLRNHDELTLEMVTDEERDYMYRVYAHDPAARLNLGIRRRLAPLLNNDRKKIELMNGLLFSLPGTPVIYYGDEIGMGDNFYLGDRNGVRTPMQWSPDRNAGFSRANPQKLYLPPIIDPEYHYEAVNVENQQNNPDSLLWWMKRLIGLSRRYKAFGRGGMEFLLPDNRRVLAFVRRYQEETILVVANLSRTAQHVQLNLAEFKGMVPVELFGRSEFPPIGEGSYSITLGTYGFYWFSIEPQRADSRRACPLPAESVAPPLTLAVREERVFQRDGWHHLERVLPRYLAGRRWFRGKARSINAVEVKDVVPMSMEGSAARLVLAEVSYGEGEPETYVVPLAVARAEGIDRILAEYPHAVVARIRPRGGDEIEGLLFDALVDEGFCTGLLGAIARRRRFQGEYGAVVAQPTRAFRSIRGPADAPLGPSPVKAEQSNTSVLYGDRLILKLFRRVEEGLNPDLEIGRALTERALYSHTPPLAGALEYHKNKGKPISLAILQELVHNEGDAWHYTLDSLDRYFERVLAHPTVQVPPLPQRSLLALGGDVPSLAHEAIGPYLESARLLGERTAGLHEALASVPDDPDFSPEWFSAMHQNSLYHSMRGLTVLTMWLLQQRLADLSPQAAERAREVMALEKAIVGRFSMVRRRKISAARIRCHGDYHLGQVLHTGKDFVIIDFEGEPARPLSERRLKRSPLVDVAGMIRSFDYAAHTATRRQASSVLQPDDLPVVEQWGRFWYTWVSASFLAAYLAAMSRTDLVPASVEELKVLLDAYLLEKAIYEVGYELNNRPDWVTVPLQGIVQLMETME